MWLTVSNQATKVTQASREELDWLRDYLGVEDAKAKFRTGEERPQSLLNPFNATFPTGLLELVLDGTKEGGLRAEVLDQRRQPCQPDPEADIGWLTDYQEEALEYAARKHRGIFWHPTGAGKTEIMVALPLIYRCRWVVFVHRKSLLKEIAERFESRTGEEAGVVGDGQWKVRRFTVVMFQSIYQRLAARDPKVLKLLRSAEAFSVDECHTTPADSFWQCCMAMENAYFRFGFSGTPLARGDKKGLLVVACCGPVLHRIRAPELVAKGAIARGRVVLVPHVENPPKGLRLTYDEVYDARIARSLPRLALSIAVCRKAPKPMLVFVRYEAHGKLLERALNQAGVPAEFTWGKKKTPEREAAIRRLEHADTDVLVCSVIFQEGVNIPGLKSVGNFGGGKSDIATLQNAGRGSRRRDRDGSVTKDEFTVFDIVDRHCGCRYVSEVDDKLAYRHRPCMWVDQHAQARAAAYMREGYEVVDGSDIKVKP